jgi:hypothetical protein
MIAMHVASSVAPVTRSGDATRFSQEQALSVGEPCMLAATYGMEGAAGALLATSPPLTSKNYSGRLAIHPPSDPACSLDSRFEGLKAAGRFGGWNALSLTSQLGGIPMDDNT